MRSQGWAGTSPVLLSLAGFDFYWSCSSIKALEVLFWESEAGELP